MRYVVPLILSCLLALAHPELATAQPPPPELPEIVPNLKDCADAMRVWREGRPDPQNPAKRIKQPLGLTKYEFRVVSVDGKANQFRLTVVPIATVIYQFEWPNMSANDRAAIVRHLPALRAHERRHWEIATKFAASKQPVTIYPTDTFTGDHYLKQEFDNLEKEQKTYDNLTLTGEGQSVLGPEWENLVFNCWPIHVVSQGYTIEVDVHSGSGFSREVADYSAEELDPLGALFAGIPVGEGRRTQPVIRRLRSGQAPQPDGMGAPIAVGESFWPIHVVELPEGSARAGVDLKFTSGQREFIVDGIVGLNTATSGSYGESRAMVQLTFMIGSPTAASVVVSGCELFTKDLFPALNVDRDGEECSFRLTQMLGDDYVVVFDIDARVKSTSPPRPTTRMSKITKSFQIRITEEQK